MIENNLYESSKVVDRLDVICDKCYKQFTRTKKNIKVSRKRLGIDACQSCAAKISIDKKPQCNNEFWDDAKRLEHGETLKNSENYRSGLENRIKLFGELNPMYGKKHSVSTRNKMSESRKGKFGTNSTAWKGGKQSLIKRLKQYNYMWFLSVKERDLYTCQKCKCSESTMDAHHIKPLSIIVKELKEVHLNKTDDELFLILKDNPEIKDVELKNGITLCRSCHKDLHDKWGSKYNP